MPIARTTILLITFAASAWAGEPGIEWLRQIGPLAPAPDVAFAVAYDDGVYATGYVGGAVEGQAALGGVADAVLLKYAADGTLVWARQFGTTGNDFARGVAADASGIYVVSDAPGTVLFLRKFDHDGNEVWSRQFGTGTGAGAFGVGVDSSGIYVGGHTSGAFPGFTNAGLYDFFVRKYDFDGNEIWTRQVGSTGSDTASSLAVGTSGIYIAGFTTGTFPGETKVGALGADAVVLKYDADGNKLWTRQFGDPFWGASAQGLFADGGGVYVAGHTFGHLTPPSNAGSDDAFVRRYDADGNAVWTRQFGSTAQDDARGIAADASGVYVAGWTLGTLPGQTHLGGKDAFLKKFDSTGGEIWTRQYGTDRPDEGLAVAVGGSRVFVAGDVMEELALNTTDIVVHAFDADGADLWQERVGSSAALDDAAQAVDAEGNVFVAGQTRGHFPDDPPGGDASPHAFLQKYDAFGNEIWTRRLGTQGGAASGVASTASGVYVAGYVTGALPGQTALGQQDVFLRKYDGDGNELWTRQLGTNLTEHDISLAADASGVYVVGSTSGTLAGETGAGFDDGFIVKYDHDGALLWAHQFGTAGTDIPFAISASASGVYVTGATGGTFPGETNDGSASNAFVRKYDMLGNHVWTHQFGSTGFASNHGRAVCGDDSGAYVAGLVGGALPGQTAHGGWDAFVRRYDADGNVVWTQQVGTPALDWGLAAAADATGVYLGGKTNGGLGGDNAGGSDCFVAKFDPTGTPLWTFQFGTDDDDEILGLSVDSSGLVAVGGTYGTLAGEPTVLRQRDGFVARIVETAPKIEVSPLAVLFPDTKELRTSTAIVTLQNVGDADLTVSFVSLVGTAFSLDAVPSLPLVLAPGGAADVQVSFTPPTSGDFAGTLTIASNDHDTPAVDVSLAGTGVPREPDEQLSDLLDFLDGAVASGDLAGSGEGASADGRLGALRNMLEAAGNAIASGNVDAARAQLTQAYSRVDGDPRPPDFAEGDAASDLATLILELLARL